PVLLEASVEGLALRPDGRYVDVTFGGGGHSRRILAGLGEAGRLVAFDRDPDARANLPEDGRLVFVPEDFKFFEAALTRLQLLPVDGILADLGISSHQIDTPERGFSYRFEAPLDMRMNPTQGRTAADLVNEEDEAELVRIFRDWGEVPNARKLARRLAEVRGGQPISTTGQFEQVIEGCIPPKRRAKYLAQVYQALRIEVNGEMEALAALLTGALRVLKPGGRLAVISYHSLEDRMVKRFMRSGEFRGVVEKDFYGNPLTPWTLITRRALQAGAAEVAANPRARSARLRIAEKKGP
ncbi:MAG: 16S rRNA (cytosine(1402)-N(4))-methyltransferase RsmH, partial [Bacteroidetes bacterium]